MIPSARCFVSIFIAFSGWCNASAVEISHGPHAAAMQVKGKHESPHVVSFTPEGLPADNPFRGFEVFEATGLVRFYSSDVSDATLPTAIFVPGSGCDAAFSLSDGVASVSAESLVPGPGVRLIRLEPPGVARQQRSVEPGAATGCPDTFLESASLDRNISHYSHAIESAQRLFSHPPNGLMVVGTSDGASIAPFLVSRHPEISHLVLIAGGGGTQLFDELELAFRRTAQCGDGDQTNCPKDAARRHGQSIINAWRDLLSDDPTTALAWYRGHPPARWQSLGLAHTAEALLASCCARLYLVHGGRDEQVSPANFSFLMARLVEHHRPFVAEFVACGDHMLICPGELGPDRLTGVLRRAFDWFSHGRVDSAHAMVHAPAPEPQDVAAQ